MDMIIDYITGQPKPNAGAEANRQHIERCLVDVKGYTRSDIAVDVPISLTMGDECYQSTIDLIVMIHGVRYLVIKSAPGSLDSREREVIAAARLLAAYQIPLASASDGKTAIVWDTISGKKIGQGLDAIPTKALAEQTFDPTHTIPLAESRRSRQQLIFRSYDSMNINIA